MGDESSIIKIGGPNEKAWDEKGHTNVVQIFISHDKKGIKSIQFQYAESENESLVLSQRHGSNYIDGNNFDVVKLDHPKEYITWISGSKNSSSNLLSITFGTNYGEYGPFGSFSAHNDKFCFKLGQTRQFHGFHGTTDNNYVKSIGVYQKPNITLDRSRNTNSNAIAYSILSNPL